MDPAQLITKYRSKGVLIDANLMILFFVGLYKPERVATFGPTHIYTKQDFELLVRILGEFQRRITTPHILTEAHNLTRQLGKHAHEDVSRIMASVVEDFFELHIPSKVAVQHRRYALLGLTDCITIAAAKDILVITDDFPLSNILGSLGHDALNINHIRPLGWK
jgi:hypothetical protein